MKLKPINQQVVVVFGASSGIGRETARRFARKGAAVVVASNDAEGIRSLVQEIKQQGGQSVGVIADATKFDQVQVVAETAVQRYGRLDTWVHAAAAVSVYAPFEQTTPEEFARVLNVNLMGQVHGVKAALPYLRLGNGAALILISSVESMISLPFNSAYAASKHGVHGMVQALRLELRHDNAPISLTEIMPASIDTPLFAKAGTKLSVEPMGIPPIYPPQMVADAILHAATHPVREIVVGNAGKMMLLIQRFAPPLLDAMLERIAFEGQKSARPKAATAPDNLYGPLAGTAQVQGAERQKLKEKAKSMATGLQAKTQSGNNGNGSPANETPDLRRKAIPLVGALAVAGIALLVNQSRAV